MSTESRIQELAALPDGWDGYGASHIMPGAVDAARAILVAVDMPGAEAYPMANGALQLEWPGTTAVISVSGEDPVVLAEIAHQTASVQVVGPAAVVAIVLGALLRSA